MNPHHINPAQWSSVLGYARQSCARIFRDGGSPHDALAAFGLRSRAQTSVDWVHAVEDIAVMLCGPAH